MPSDRVRLVNRFADALEDAADNIDRIPDAHLEAITLLVESVVKSIGPRPPRLTVLK
ncbi:hypothetical protein J8M97_08490 [Gordonia polyisoprenivorans]|uniref:hypothetical protein n=1 Tax=Gordonia polyisoprenivorans TaxID=84595 RepID=UPI001B8D06D7|nr:hypothetical protein [Gordonia polyisoprenivorans]QUD84602.1 hypothetical protein J8M97_08490 [Gordonia polyisoprenivorans]